MTDESAVGEAPAVETTHNPPAEAGSSSRDFESEARDQGWRPKDEWTGKPENWKDAKTYVEWGEIPNRVDRVEKLVAERVGKIEKVTANTIARMRREHEKEIADLKADKRAAVQRGDVDAVDALDQQIEELREAGPDGDKPKGETAEQHSQRVAAEWTKGQSWWSDKAARGWAIEHSKELAEATPDMTIEDNLKQTLDAVKKQFPDLVGGRTGANGHAPVDGGGAFAGARSDPLSKLPNEARAQAKKDMAAYPKVYPSAEAWIKAYNS